jgi:hypothetical protein
MVAVSTGDTAAGALPDGGMIVTLAALLPEFRRDAALAPNKALTTRPADLYDRLIQPYNTTDRRQAP